MVRDDYGFRGFFELRTPKDLLEKLRHDHRRLAANPLGSYAAFDFFVTANHLVDWVWPCAEREQQRKNRRSETLPRICEHLADGAKHFQLSSPHQGVSAVTKTDGFFDPGVFDPDFFDVGELIVTLEPTEAIELDRQTITAIDLATLVLAYWERRLGQ